MVNTLETLSWIAAVVAVPVAVIGWFFGGKRKTNQSVARRGATASAGDVRVGTAGIVTGHNSPVSFELTLGNELEEKTSLLRESWGATAITLVAHYFGHCEPDEVTLPCQSLSLFDADFKTEYDAIGIPQCRRLITPAFIRATGIDLTVIRKLTWKPQQLLFNDAKTGKQLEFFVIGVDVIKQEDTVNFFTNSPSGL
jgi:hypothetical protein